ncbi:hypothetical protein [Nakamurella leprariae]|uniref:Uncharacterized protein n=1 Tax=Nakamurella leprariae TaxID=2803911 RepID=A0A939BW85_9ACTN|nr:hypothetical protein [Nakamurella leprariae]MBM9467288.1 hypothetical protein [Nakamurella leprariae]
MPSDDQAVDPRIDAVAALLWLRDYGDDSWWQLIAGDVTVAERLQPDDDLRPRSPEEWMEREVHYYRQGAAFLLTRADAVDPLRQLVTAPTDEQVERITRRILGPRPARPTLGQAWRHDDEMPATVRAVLAAVAAETSTGGDQ